MLQSVQLAYLVEAFKQESTDHQSVATPEDEAGQWQLLQSLMNIRLPKPLDPTVMAIQDDYLKHLTEQKGIVDWDSIPTVAKQLNSQHPWGDILVIWQGDITRLAIPAIVNAANPQMLGCFVPLHTCIDNVIHTYAGVQLRLACHQTMTKLKQKHGSDYEQPTAKPLITPGFNLPAEHVIHVVGPIITGSVTHSLANYLAGCYWRCLELCRKKGLEAIAFCGISTGVYGFPHEAAAQIAVITVTKWLQKYPESIKRVIFNVFKDEDRIDYEKLLSE